MGAQAVNEAGSQPLRSDWPPRLGNSSPPARPGESPDWRACPALGFHSEKSMKQRERGGGGKEPRQRRRKCTNQLLPRAHNCRLRPENKPVRWGPGAGAASLWPSPAALRAAPGMLGTPRGSSTDARASGEAAGVGERERVRDSQPSL